MEIDINDRAFKFACRMVKLCQFMESHGRVSTTLANQLLRSSTSIGANIAEAQASQSKADFTAKMYIACKESRETQYWLRLLIETKVIPANKLEDLLDESNQIVAILTAITKKARNNK